MSKQYYYNCSVTGCPNTTLVRPKLAFFSIPADERRDKWLKLISREDLRVLPPLSRSRRICEEHFSRDVIIFTNTRRRLKKTALPSRCLPYLEGDIVIENDAEPSSSDSTINLTSKLTQTDSDWDEEIEVSKVVATSDSTIDFKDERSTLYDLCEKHLTKDLASLIKANDSLRYKNVKSSKDDYSQLCFNLYQTSPQVYQFFQAVYGLPFYNILLKQNIQTGTKVNDTVMLTIKARVDKMSDKEKNCSVLISSVNLKANLCYNIKEDKIYGFQEINGIQGTEPTTQALAVMIRGLFSNWKTLIGYILVPQTNSKDKIHEWIDSLIKQLFEIGLNVRTLVSSTKDDWIYDISKGYVSIDLPFFLVNEKKIYHIFDAPELIKSARDCLILHDIHFQDKVAKYEDIVKFYNVDRTKNLPYAHKLTESHVSPKNKEKEEVKYAIQLLSKSVANGLWNYINFELIKNANIGTVEFISNVNDYFDILNVSRKRDDTGRSKALCEKDTQEKLKEMLLFFQNLKVINPKNGQDITLTVQFLKGMLVTIKAMSLLLNDLKIEGYSACLTRNLHLEALDDSINKLTSYVKRKPAKLTTLQFTVAFRKMFFSNIKKFTQRGSTKGEVKNFVAKTRQMDYEMAQSGTTREDLYSISNQSSTKISKPRFSRTNDNEQSIYEEDYNKIATSEKHSLLYICGYLLMKSKRIHKICHGLKHYLYCHVYEPSLDTGRYRRYNQYMQNQKTTHSIPLPAAPCDSFIRFVEQMDEKFAKALTSKHLCQRIADSVYKDIEEIDFTPPCPCFPKKYVVKLFIRIKIFYTIRTNNKLFKIKTNRQSRKYLTVPNLS